MNTPAKHRMTVGDTRTPITARLVQDGRAVDTNGLTLTFRMVDDAGNAKVNDSTHTAQASTVAFTVDTATNEIIKAGHGLIVGDEIVLTNSGGALPTGLAASTIYFVRAATLNRFTVSAEPGGDVVDITTSGSGTHSYRALGHVQYAWQAADVDGLDADNEELEAGGVREYRAWFIVTESGADDHFPPQGENAPQFIVQVYSNE
jgi:hypothetical protein